MSQTTGYRVVDSEEIEPVTTKSDGEEPDAGHAHKTLIKGEEMVFKWVILEPGASGPEDGFVIHPDCEQVEYIVYGNGSAMYPDGETFPLKQGSAIYNAAGQPHRFENTSNEPMIFVVATVLGDKDDEERVPFIPDGWESPD